MKKINLLLIALLLVVTVSAQKRKAEKRLIGTWTLKEIEIENADEVAQSVLDIQIDLLERQISQLEEMIKYIEDETEKETYVKQLEESKLQKSEFTLESIKEGFNEEFDNMKGAYKLVFNKDQSFKSPLDNKEGTWGVNKKVTELILTDEEGDTLYSFYITELSKKYIYLILIERHGELEIIINFVFVKD